MPVSVERRAAIGSFVFAVLFTVPLIIAGKLPTNEESDAEILPYFTHTKWQIAAFSGAILVAAAGLLFVWLLAYLYQRLRASSSEGAVLPVVVLLNGLLFVAMLFVGSAVFAFIPVLAWGNSIPDPGVEIARIVPQLGMIVFFFFGSLAASAFVATLSWGVSRTRILPLWLARCGYVASFILIFGVILVPTLALTIWMILLSIALARSPGSTETAVS